VPTYDYHCDQCGRTYEVRQKISEPPLEACQHCGGRVRRLLAAAPFILKGGGWYVTDYPSEARKKAMDAEKKAVSSTETTAPATTSAAKPAAGETAGASAAKESKG
jgi:putative FmdB family regulatory protein